MNLLQTIKTTSIRKWSWTLQRQPTPTPQEDLVEGQTSKNKNTSTFK